MGRMLLLDQDLAKIRQVLPKSQILSTVRPASLLPGTFGVGGFIRAPGLFQPNSVRNIKFFCARPSHRLKTRKICRI